MICFPKPRGFWDYALFALVMTGLLVLLFWVEASNRISWGDAVLAGAESVLFVLAVILSRGSEKAKWIVQPTWHAYLVATLGVSVALFGAVYVDAYLFHRADITSNRIRHDMVFTIVLSSVALWTSLRRWHRARRRLS